MVDLIRKIGVISFGFVLVGCPIYDPPSGVLAIKNQSNENIYVYSTCNDLLPCNPPLRVKYSLGDNAYDDNGNKIDTSFYPDYRIEVDSIGYIAVWGSPRKPKVYCKDGKIRLYMISESKIKTNNWEDICKSQQYEKKVVYTQKELDNLDWKISYP
jgi:hypothetical protein